MDRSNTRIHNTMEDHIEDEVDSISLSGLQFEDDEEVSKTNLTSSSSSSSSSSSFEHDFLGFFSEEWSRDPSYNTSPENIIFCGKIVSSNSSVSHVKKPEMNRRTNTLFRSASDSLRFMYTASMEITPRSKSVATNRLSSSSSSTLSSSSLSSSCNSKWRVFVFGLGSGKFPTTMDISNIKSRQLRQQSTMKVGECKEESGGRKSGKGWWRLVDVLGCNGGYERDTMVVV